MAPPTLPRPDADRNRPPAGPPPAAAVAPAPPPAPPAPQPDAALLAEAARLLAAPAGPDVLDRALAGLVARLRHERAVEAEAARIRTGGYHRPPATGGGRR